MERSIAPGAEMKDVFISYSNKDSELARKLRDCVEREGHSCWMAPDDIKGPKTYAEQILEGIRGSRAMIVVVSDSANTSGHVPREVSLASEGDTPILPVRVEDVLPTGALEYLLQLRHWVDAFPGPIEDHVDSLKEAIDAVLQQGGDGSVLASEQDEAAPSSGAAWHEYLEMLSSDESSTAWRLHDPVLGRDISVRELHVPEGMSPEETSAQWGHIEREIARAVSVKHANVGEVYGAWRIDDRFMISSELLEGETLETMLRRGPLPEKTAFALVMQIASAVSYTHGKGVPHAGIRPSNVFLTPEGTARLAGGSVAFSPGVAPERHSEQLTAVDPTGSPGYLAPEQLRGSPPSELADEFGLAVLAYEMLTGRNPFGSIADGDENEILRRTLTEPMPGVAASGIDFPQAEAVDGVLARASEKDPAKRYPSVADFGSALREAWTTPKPVAAVPEAMAAPVVAAAAAAAAAPVPAVAVAPLAGAVPTAAPVPVAAVASVPEDLDATPELDDAAFQDSEDGTVPTPEAIPGTSRRARTVLVASIASVAVIGLIAAGFFGLRGSLGGASESTEESPAGPTGAELLDSAGKALEDRHYSVATSMATAAFRLDPSLEASATWVIDEVERLEEIALVEPAAARAFADHKWSAAATAYARLVKLDPDDPTFKKRLAEATRQSELLRLYSLGKKHEKAHAWSKAKRAYEQVVAKDKKYKDAAERLARVKAALSPPASSGGGGSGGGSSGGGSTRSPTPKKPSSPPPGGEEL